MEAKKSYLSRIFLILIIILQLAWTSYNFIANKQGCHSDEIWSYGLANSYYQPFIYMKDGVFIDDASEESLINLNTWTTGETYHDYITVQKGERFAYGSVYHNQSLDHHPPLYYALLHTICSFFPDTFSFAFAFILSCIFLVFTQIFLFKLMKLLTGSDIAALACCGLYGFGTGALSTFIFLRQYSLLTMLGVMYTYFNTALFKSQDLNLKKYLAPILITAFCMFMTHYTGIAYAGVFTACFCIYLLCRKKIKKMFIYGGGTAGALLLYIAVYPASIKQIFGYSSYENKIMTYSMQVKTMFSYAMQYNFGFAVSKYTSPFWNIVLAVLICMLAVIIPLCFLFRKETWFIAFKGKVIEFIKSIPAFLRSANYVPLFMLLSASALLAVMAHTTDLLKMGDYSMRYIFMSFPIFCAVMVTVVYFVISHLPCIKKAANVICCVCAAAVVVFVNITQPCQFFFKHANGIKNASTLFDGKNCLIVLSDTQSSWTITCYTWYLQNADNVWFTTSDTFEEHLDEINSSDVKFDYVISNSDLISLTDSEESQIISWEKALSSEKSNAEITVGGNADAFDISKNYRKCSDLIKKLNGGCEYEIIYGLNIANGSNDLVLKLK